ncbi:uncharacterized protein LOC134814313 [Bolinopsis microptera]|uniref:uncharacterized protein LOC134814313 n=1 Tax=Bolinopsis microptera TaxID=2820187 RepID=UPI0030799449
MLFEVTILLILGTVNCAGNFRDRNDNELIPDSAKVSGTENEDDPATDAIDLDWQTEAVISENTDGASWLKVSLDQLSCVEQIIWYHTDTTPRQTWTCSESENECSVCTDSDDGDDSESACASFSLTVSIEGPRPENIPTIAPHDVADCVFGNTFLLQHQDGSEFTVFEMAIIGQEATRTRSDGEIMPGNVELSGTEPSGNDPAEYAIDLFWTSAAVVSENTDDSDDGDSTCASFSLTVSIEGPRPNNIPTIAPHDVADCVFGNTFLLQKEDGLEFTVIEMAIIGQKATRSRSDGEIMPGNVELSGTEPSGNDPAEYAIDLFWTSAAVVSENTDGASWLKVSLDQLSCVEQLIWYHTDTTPRQTWTCSENKNECSVCTDSDDGDDSDSACASFSLTVSIEGPSSKTIPTIAPHDVADCAFGNIFLLQKEDGSEFTVFELAVIGVEEATRTRSDGEIMPGNVKPSGTEPSGNDPAEYAIDLFWTSAAVVSGNTDGASWLKVSLDQLSCVEQLIWYHTDTTPRQTWTCSENKNECSVCTDSDDGDDSDSACASFSLTVSIEGPRPENIPTIAPHDVADCAFGNTFLLQKEDGSEFTVFELAVIGVEEATRTRSDGEIMPGNVELSGTEPSGNDPAEYAIDLFWTSAAVVSENTDGASWLKVSLDQLSCVEQLIWYHTDTTPRQTWTCSENKNECSVCTDSDDGDDSDSACASFSLTVSIEGPRPENIPTIAPHDVADCAFGNTFLLQKEDGSEFIVFELAVIGVEEATRTRSDGEIMPGNVELSGTEPSGNDPAEYAIDLFWTSAAVVSENTDGASWLKVSLDQLSCVEQLIWYHTDTTPRQTWTCSENKNECSVCTDSDDGDDSDSACASFSLTVSIEGPSPNNIPTIAPHDVTDCAFGNTFLLQKEDGSEFTVFELAVIGVEEATRTRSDGEIIPGNVELSGTEPSGNDPAEYAIDLFWTSAAVVSENTDGASWLKVSLDQLSCVEQLIWYHTDTTPRQTWTCSENKNECSVCTDSDDGDDNDSACASFSLTVSIEGPSPENIPTIAPHDVADCAFGNTFLLQKEDGSEFTVFELAVIGVEEATRTRSDGEIVPGNVELSGTEPSGNDPAEYAIDLFWTSAAVVSENTDGASWLKVSLDQLSCVEQLIWYHTDTTPRQTWTCSENKNECSVCTDSDDSDDSDSTCASFSLTVSIEGPSPKTIPTIAPHDVTDCAFGNTFLLQKENGSEFTVFELAVIGQEATRKRGDDEVMPGNVELSGTEPSGNNPAEYAIDLFLTSAAVVSENADGASWLKVSLDQLSCVEQLIWYHTDTIPRQTWTCSENENECSVCRDSDDSDSACASFSLTVSIEGPRPENIPTIAPHDVTDCVFGNTFLLQKEDGSEFTVFEMAIIGQEATRKRGKREVIPENIKMTGADSENNHAEYAIDLFWASAAVVGENSDGVSWLKVSLDKIACVEKVIWYNTDKTAFQTWTCTENECSVCTESANTSTCPSFSLTVFVEGTSSENVAGCVIGNELLLRKVIGSNFTVFEIAVFGSGEVTRARQPSEIPPVNAEISGTDSTVTDPAIYAIDMFWQSAAVIGEDSYGVSWLKVNMDQVYCVQLVHWWKEFTPNTRPWQTWSCSQEGCGNCESTHGTCEFYSLAVSIDGAYHDNIPVTSECVFGDMVFLRKEVGSYFTVNEIAVVIRQEMLTVGWRDQPKGTWFKYRLDEIPFEVITVSKLGSNDTITFEVTGSIKPLLSSARVVVVMDTDPTFYVEDCHHVSLMVNVPVAPDNVRVWRFIKHGVQGLEIRCNGVQVAEIEFGDAPDERCRDSVWVDAERGVRYINILDEDDTVRVKEICQAPLPVMPNIALEGSFGLFGDTVTLSCDKKDFVWHGADQITCVKGDDGSDYYAYEGEEPECNDPEEEAREVELEWDMNVWEALIGLNTPKYPVCNPYYKEYYQDLNYYDQEVYSFYMDYKSFQAIGDIFKSFVAALFSTLGLFEWVDIVYDKFKSGIPPISEILSLLNMQISWCAVIILCAFILLLTILKFLLSLFSIMLSSGPSIQKPSPWNTSLKNTYGCAMFAIVAVFFVCTLCGLLANMHIKLSKDMFVDFVDKTELYLERYLSNVTRDMAAIGVDEFGFLHTNLEGTIEDYQHKAATATMQVEEPYAVEYNNTLVRMQKLQWQVQDTLNKSMILLQEMNSILEDKQGELTYCYNGVVWYCKTRKTFCDDVFNATNVEPLRMVAGADVANWPYISEFNEIVAFDIPGFTFKNWKIWNTTIEDLMNHNEPYRIEHMEHNIKLLAWITENLPKIETIKESWKLSLAGGVPSRDPAYSSTSSSSQQSSYTHWLTVAVFLISFLTCCALCGSLRVWSLYRR